MCGGLGQRFNVDPTLVRVLFLVLAIFGGAGILLYVAMWIIVPRNRWWAAPPDLPGAERLRVVVVRPALGVPLRPMGPLLVVAEARPPP